MANLAASLSQQGQPSEAERLREMEALKQELSSDNRSPAYFIDREWLKKTDGVEAELESMFHQNGYVRYVLVALRIYAEPTVDMCGLGLGMFCPLP
jgi:hypothetical protein